MWIYTPRSRGHILRSTNQLGRRWGFWHLRRFTHQEYWHFVRIIIFLVLLLMGVRLGSVIFFSMMQRRGAFYARHVKLPQATSAEYLPFDRHMVYITASQHLNFVGIRDRWTEIDDIPAVMKTIQYRHLKLPVVLVVDKDTPMRVVGEIVDTLRANGINELAFMTAFETGSRESETPPEMRPCGQLDSQAAPQKAPKD